MAQTYLDLEGLTYFKEKQDLLNASTYATTSYVNTLVDNNVASAYKYKGSKDAVASLPSTGNSVGDVWNVTATDMNYAWNGSAWDALGTTYSEATTSAAGLMSASDKEKLNGIAVGANAYTHPTTAGNKHIPAGGSSGQILKWSASGTAVWGSEKTYPNASSTTDGLMSAEMYSKIEELTETGGEPNQNAFAKVTVAGTTIEADQESDTLTITAGSNITLTPNASGDSFSIAATDTVYTHPSHTAKNSGLYKVTVDSKGHVSEATAVTKADITALGIPSQDTVITVDSALSSTSTNPVQNKVVNTALAAKAPLASPALTGTPTAPTAAAGTDTTQIATTAFVQAATESIAASAIDALFS